MHHDRDPAHVPDPNPQGEGMGPLTLEQLQALAQMAQMAQVMAAMSSQPGMNLPATAGALALPGQLQVLGVTDMQALIDAWRTRRRVDGRRRP